MDILEEIHGDKWADIVFGRDSDWDFLKLADPSPTRGPAFLISGRQWPEDDAEWWDGEDAEYLLQHVQDLLGEAAGPYIYFGTREVDGADFGFWPCIQALEYAIEEGDVPRLPEVPEYIAQVSDHGNLTLYRVTVEEVWSVV